MPIYRKRKSNPLILQMFFITSLLLLDVGSINYGQAVFKFHCNYKNLCLNSVKTLFYNTELDVVLLFEKNAKWSNPDHKIDVLGPRHVCFY